MTPVVLRTLAQIEFDEAHDFYESRVHGLGKRFSDTVQRLLDRIGMNPKIYPIAKLDIHRAIVPGFPYRVYYYMETLRVVVISVFHTSRNPAIWQGRR